jgi:hypothetical protein
MHDPHPVRIVSKPNQDHLMVWFVVGVIFGVLLGIVGGALFAAYYVTKDMF